MITSDEMLKYLVDEHTELLKNLGEKKCYFTKPKVADRVFINVLIKHNEIYQQLLKTGKVGKDL